MRCNVGVDPKLLTVPHLVAEYREIPMIIGSLRINNYVIKSKIPANFKLGPGHMNFLKNKLLYLKRRYEAVVKEMHRRGYKANIDRLDLSKAPECLLNDWNPTLKDSLILRYRIIDKIKMKPKFYKVENAEEYSNMILNSELFYV